MAIVYMIVHAFNKFAFQIDSANDASIRALALACALIAVFCSLLTCRYIAHPFIAKRNPARAARPTAEPAPDRRTAYAVTAPAAQNRYEIPICSTGYHR